MVLSLKQSTVCVIFYVHLCYRHTLVHKAVSEQNKKMSFVVELKTQVK